ncbi:MAG: 4a-hydroxytetrahydrobiopterin dehydratase [Gammaproteobacteria bacterium]|nr:4a-hydroxytetrahydrobiopterin dehydratase [Gammaproteobacteria bacterium]
MNKPLNKMNCEPCRFGGRPVTDAEAREMLIKIPAWRRETRKGVKRLLREFSFIGFDDAFEFSGRIADLAREQDHHPTMLVEYGKVTIRWWTHKINGLHMNDFIMAAKTDDIFREMAEVRN